MGNSSSKSPSASYISNPGRLKGLDDKSSEGVHRRATAHASSHTSLSLQVPSSGTHRRSRSALVAGEHRRGSQAPPPSYQEALRSPVNSPTTDADNNNNLLTVPAPQGVHRSRSQDATRSRNPFVQRPVSYNGSARSSVAGGDPLSAGSASPAVAWSMSAPGSSSRSPSAAVPKWTTDEERLAYLRRPLRQESYEDALEILRRYDTVIVVDDSSSMTKENRWSEVNAFEGIIVLVRADTDIFCTGQKRACSTRRRRCHLRCGRHRRIFSEQPKGGQEDEGAVYSTVERRSSPAHLSRSATSNRVLRRSSDYSTVYLRMVSRQSATSSTGFSEDISMS